MIIKWRAWFLPAFVLAFLAAGCGPPSVFTVETVVHPDGSCDRTIGQPRYECLPAEALKPEWIGRIGPVAEAQPVRPQEPLKPEWVARWKSMKYVKGPPASPRAGRQAGREDYFIASGSFPSPREIPPHYRRTVDEYPEAGASDLRRTYERIDRAFVVEHRWSERITDIVTLPGFLEARDKILDILLPLGLRLLADEFGPDYDISGLSDLVRRDVRRTLEEAAVLVYDAGVRGRTRRDDETIDAGLADRLVALSRRIGFDPLDARGKRLANEELDGRIRDFLRRVVLERVRHRDGSPMGRSDWDALIARWSKQGRFMEPDSRQQERLKQFVGPLVPRMMGIYGVPLIRLSPAPEFAFTLRLPGELVETNGIGQKGGRTRWAFTGDDIFPDGYEMRARSLEIDRDAQKKALGRVAIDDEETALEFLELLGVDKPLLEAVRKLKETGDRVPLRDDSKRTPEQILRARRLREMLLGRRSPPGEWPSRSTSLGGRSLARMMRMGMWVVLMDESFAV